MEVCRENDTKLVLRNETIPMEPYVQYILGLAMTVLIIVTVVGNLMTVAAYIIDKRLHNVYNTFIFNLAITDLLIGLISMPFHAWYTVGEFNWPLGRVVCKFWLVVDYTLCFESVLMILLLSYDRYLLIRYGHRYEAKVTLKRSVVKIVITWIVAFSLWGPFIIGWDILKECTIIGKTVCDVEFLYAYEYLLTTAIIEFFMPFKGLVIINSILYCKLRRFLVKIKLSEDDTAGLTSDTLETLTEGEDAMPTRSPNEAVNVALEQTVGVIKSEDEIKEREHKVDKTNKTSNVDTLRENKLKSESDENDTLPKNQQDVMDEHDSNDDKEKRDLSETIGQKEGTGRSGNKIAHPTDVEADLQHITDRQTKTEDSVPRRSREYTKHGNESESLAGAMADDADTEPSEIMKSVLGVMEKHGSRLFSTSSTENILDPTQDIEAASDISGMGSVESETSKSRNEITSTLKRKFSGVASKFFGTAQNVENVGLENVKQRKQSAERENGAEKHYKEVDIDQAIRERNSASAPSQRKESMTSNVTSRVHRDKKAARFLAILVGVFFVCWAPYTIATVWQVFCPKNKKTCVNRILYEALNWLLWSKSAINPFLYAYNSSRYKRNFKRFLSSCCRKRN